MAERNRNRAKLYGRYDNGLVDAGPVREHIFFLQSFGYGWKRIAELSGVGNTAVESLVYGRKGSNSDPRKGEVLARTTRAKAAAIMAVRPDIATLADGALVPARGTHRRVKALVSRGWSQSKLAGLIGMNPANFGGMLKRTQVTVATHRAMAEVYERLWDQLPPREEWRDKIAYTRSLSYARKHRWLPPLAWDDIDHDPTPEVVDDEGGIDEIAVELAMRGERVKLTFAERREAVTRLHRLRWSDNRIAGAVHIAPRSVLRIRQELGLAAYPQDELVHPGRAA